MSHKSTTKRLLQYLQNISLAVSIFSLGTLGVFLEEAHAKRSLINPTPTEGIHINDFQIIGDTTNFINQNLIFDPYADGLGIGVAANSHQHLKVEGNMEVWGTLRTKKLLSEKICNIYDSNACININDIKNCTPGGTPTCEVDRTVNSYWDFIPSTKKNIEYSSGKVTIGTPTSTSTKKFNIHYPSKIEGSLNLSFGTATAGDSTFRIPNKTNGFYWQQDDDSQNNEDIMQLNKNGKLILYRSDEDAGLVVNGKSNFKKDVEIGHTNDTVNLSLKGDISIKKGVTSGGDLTILKDIVINKDITIKDLSVNENLDLNNGTLTSSSATFGTTITIGNNKIWTQTTNHKFVFEKSPYFTDIEQQGFSFRVTEKNTKPEYKEVLFISEKGDVKSWGKILELAVEKEGNIAIESKNNNFLFHKRDPDSIFSWKKNQETLMEIDKEAKMIVTKDGSVIIGAESSNQNYGLHISKKSSDSSGNIDLIFTDTFEGTKKFEGYPQNIKNKNQGGLMIESDIIGDIASVLIRNNKTNNAFLSLYTEDTSSPTTEGQAHIGATGDNMKIIYDETFSVTQKEEEKEHPKISMKKGKITISDNSDEGFTEIISGKPGVKNTLSGRISTMISKNLNQAPSTGAPPLGGTSKIISDVGGIRIHGHSKDSQKIPGLVLTNSSIANPTTPIGTGILFQHATSSNPNVNDVGYIASLSGDPAHNGANFLQMQSLKGDIIFGAGEKNDRNFLMQSKNFKVEPHKLTIHGIVSSKGAGRYNGGDKNRAMIFQVTDTDTNSNFNENLTGFHFRLDPDPPHIISDQHNGADVGYKTVVKIRNNGNVYANRYLYLSDENYKKNIKPIENALQKIEKINGIQFEWRKIANKPKGKYIGLIAQEVESVFPETVHENAAQQKTVNYSELVGPLIEAIKELKENNENLRAEIEILENEYSYTDRIPRF